MQGWVKIHRQIVLSDIYLMPPLYLRVFERLIIEANHCDNEILYKDKEKKLTGKKLIRRGERLTSVRDICRWVAWYERGKLKEPNPKTIQNILDWLEQNDMIFIYGEKGNRKETYYKIVNYEDYQKKDNEEVTEKKQTSNSKVTEKKQSADTNKNVKNVKNDKKYIYDENSNEFRLASFLLKHLLKNNPNFKQPDLQTWARDMDLLLRVDKRKLEEVKLVIEFCQNDGFWKTNILSANKLRKQYDRLNMQRIEELEKAKAVKAKIYPIKAIADSTSPHAVINGGGYEIYDPMKGRGK